MFHKAIVVFLSFGMKTVDFIQIIIYVNFFFFSDRHKLWTMRINIYSYYLNILCSSTQPSQKSINIKVLKKIITPWVHGNFLFCKVFFSLQACLSRIQDNSGLLSLDAQVSYCSPSSKKTESKSDCVWGTATIRLRGCG